MTEVPLHSRIRETIEGRLRDGEWPAQHRLPSEPELAEEFKVSRMTVRQAVQHLVNEGLLYRRRGVGTFVSPRTVQRDLTKLTSFSEDAQDKGLRPRSEVRGVKVVPADEHVALKLDIPVGELVTRVERLRHLDEHPIALQTVWIPHRLCPELAETDAASGSIYDYLENHHHYRLAWGVQTMTARQPRRDERQILQLPRSAALMCVERTTFLDDGTPIELSEAVYNSEEQSFTITLHR
ncbi:GntR family transcriptional regulator [Amycolatopsis sp. NPDC051372]|uniref:GntR family transcriptional regulator n=1 Tax=Amycolatopsis sp. NPDC051372 TaxID=3155669 RepID=UPI003424310D